MSRQRTEAARVLWLCRSHGLTTPDLGEVEHDYFVVHSAEASFVVGPEGVDVMMWSGAYPFAVEHPMGTLVTPEEAVRYAVWLLKREAFYQERDEAKWRELEEQP
jgi:hypothetical protein